MKPGVVFTTLFFLISLAGSALAQTAAAPTAASVRVGPGPEIVPGVLGMALAAGMFYVIKRRNRHLI
jgi:hypothetical protein